MEDVIDPFHGREETVVIADIADVELDLGIGQADPHVFLLLLVTGEDTDLLDVGV